MRDRLVLFATALILSVGPLRAQEPAPPPLPAAPVPIANPAPTDGTPPSAPELIAPPARIGSPPPTLVPPLPPYPPYVAPPVVVEPAGPGDLVDGPEIWVGLEALVWWVKNQPLSVPVLTTGPSFEGASAGGLGMPGTASLNAPLDLDTDTGVRLFLGAWLDAAHSLGLDASLFSLARTTAGFGAFDRSGMGLFVINEPVAGAPFLTQVSAPGFDTGGATVDARTEFGGGDLNLLGNVVRTPRWTVNLLGGFRYLELDESLDIHALSTLLVTTVYTDNFGNVLATAPPGSGVEVGDFFGTHNYFYGGQIGAQFEHRLGRWFVGGQAKLALGVTQEVVTVSGASVVTPTNAPPLFLGGGNFATLQAGRYSVDRFAVAPEVQLGVGYQVGRHLRVSVGYDLVYLSSVVRPGDQIDNTYDGVVHPLVPLTRSSFWATGLTVGMQLGF